MTFSARDRHGEPLPPMWLAEQILVTIERRVAIVSISNPDACNALTPAMWHDLAETVRALGVHPDVGAVVLRGEGADFSAGEVPCELTGRHDVIALQADAERAIIELGKPVIAAVRGHCAGAACAIALAADQRLADDTARFGLAGHWLIDAEWARRTGLITELVDGDVDEQAVALAELVAAGPSLASVDDLDDLADLAPTAPRGPWPGHR